MRRPPLPLLLLLSVLGPALCAGGDMSVTSVRRAPELDALFRQDHGWTGGDGDYSIRLDENRLLWFFGDSWIGRVEGGRHVDATLVNNAVGLQSLRDGRARKLDYHWGAKADGKAEALFVPRRKKGWFWPLHGHRGPDALHLFAVRIERTARKDAFGFRSTGSALLSILEPESPPETWGRSARQGLIPHARFTERGNVLFGAAVAARGPWVYVFGTDERRVPTPIRRHALVARVGRDRISDFSAWRFWNGTDWSASYLDARPLFERVANEFSVAWLPRFGRWIAVTTDNGLSDEIHARFASKPEGPWSEPLLLHRCPEMKARPGIFTYAAKLHPDLARAPDELVLSYVTNCSNFETLMGDASLYWPLFLRIRLADERR